MLLFQIICVTVAIAVAGLLTMIVEMAFNAYKGHTGDRHYNLHVALMGATFTGVGLFFAALFSANFTLSLLTWTVAPALLWTLKCWLGGPAFGERFHRLGQGCADRLVKAVRRFRSKNTLVASAPVDKQKEDFNRMIASMEADLQARRRHDN